MPSFQPFPDIDLSILCNPFTGELLSIEGNELVSAGSGQRFPLHNGIPSFIDSTQHPRRNRFYRWFYDRAAFAYDFTLSLGPKLGYGTEQIIRREEIARLPINSRDKVLETAIGTALNAPHLPADAEYYGVDISLIMLLRAQRNLAKWNRTTNLYHADAQFLPFHDNTFEHVFQQGGLQFVHDPFRAIREMTRVAKQNAVITIIDEASSLQRTFNRLPAHSPHVKDLTSAVESLPRFVPHGMQLITAQILPLGEFYKLEFRKIL